MVGGNTVVTATPRMRCRAKPPKAGQREETNTKKPHPSHTHQREGRNPAPEEGKGGISVFDLLVLQEWMWADSRT